MKKLTQSNFNWILIYGFSDSKKIESKCIDILKIAQRMKLISRKTPVLEVGLVSKVEIKKLNKKYRKMNTLTDVLSFENPLRVHPKDFQFLGNIVICKDVAAKQAKVFKHSFHQECIILLVHALLHLLGYDHEKSPKHAKKMMELESKILKKLKVKNGLIGRTLSN